MKRHRPGFSTIDLIVIVAILGIIVGFLMVAVASARQAAKRIESINNMKQIVLAMHTYHDAENQFPTGCDKNNFSALARILPYLEQDNLNKQIDFTKPVDDKANDKVRGVMVKVFVSPQDTQLRVKDGVAPTNYVLCAGALTALKDNNGIFCQDSSVTLTNITNANGTANTLALAETRKGDGGTKAVDVNRQHVALKKDALKGLKDDAGVQDWKDNKNIAGDRCASWLDGRFLQTTFTATRPPDDTRPDVNCEGLGGLSALRSMDGKVVNCAFADGHVQRVPVNVPLKIWKAMSNWKNAELFQLP